MKFVVDTHCHTISSGHSYSTVQELAQEASRKGMEMFAITDHGPDMPGAPHIWHFGNMKVIPDEMYGVRVLKGTEANIIDMNGSLDIPEDYLRVLDWVNASFHDVCIEPGTVKQHTEAWIKVAQNPYVDAIAHSGNPIFSFDIDEVLKAVKEHGKMVEINNHSFAVRKGSEENCRIIASKCKEMGIKVVVGSDAHISYDIGKFDKVYKLFEEVGMPEDLIMNVSAANFVEYLQSKKRRIRGI